MYRIVIPCFVVICFIAIILNFCMILALRRTKIRNAVVTLILSLTVSDISTSSIVALSLLYNSYLPNVQNTSVNPCISLTLENLRSAGLLTGAFHLLLIALNHYTSIVKPHLSKKQLRKIGKSQMFLKILTSNCSSYRTMHSCLDTTYTCSHFIVIVFRKSGLLQLHPS